jgi:asparagine synthase (glutamine-hydrolysing)
MIGWRRQAADVPAGSSRPGAWLAGVGAGTAERVGWLATKGWQTRAGSNWALAFRRGPGETAYLSESADGGLSVRIGDPREAGCAVELRAADATLTARADPFGLHTVYLALGVSSTWCSSDLRALRTVLDLRPDLDTAALHGYLCFAYVPLPHTMLRDVSRLPVGSGVTAGSNGDTNITPIAESWREQPRFSGSEDEAAAALRGLLRDAVARRLGNDREAGVYLSGGLDSSVVAALLVEMGVRVRLYTLDFGHPFDEEVQWAGTVAAHLGLPLRRVPARPADIRRTLRATAAALHLPFGDAVTAPLYLLGEAAAADGLDLVFNGEGGDQLFGGWTNKPMVAAGLYNHAYEPFESTYLKTYHRFHGLTDTLYTKNAKAATTGLDPARWIRTALTDGNAATLLHRLRAANLLLKGAQNIAPRMVQLAAAHGLRTRSPFFDTALTRWTFSLPPEWLLSGPCEKYLLKRAAEPLLPAEVVWREKRGMGVPATDWLLGPLRRDTERVLSPRRLRLDGWFEPRAVAALRRGEDRETEIRRRRIGERLWALMMLHLWQDVNG